VAGSGTPLLKFIDFPSANFPVTIEHATGSGTIGPDAASANGALAVAASHYPTPTTPESFSSRGPVTHYFDASGNPPSAPEVRQKPNLATPDGVSTSVPVAGLATFFGTSAATPAAAGIAALVRMALDPTPPVIVAHVSPTTPDGANGWYRGPVSVSWNVSDTGSPVVDPSGCTTQALGDDSSVALRCTATSAGARRRCR
jgi:hypothetical protein